MSELEQKVIAAAKEWLVDRAPKDPFEKALAAAIARAWPDELGSRESCPCGGDCEECPSAAEVEAMVCRWEQASASLHDIPQETPDAP